MWQSCLLRSPYFLQINNKNSVLGQEWWCTPLTLSRDRLISGFKNSLLYIESFRSDIVKPCLKFNIKEFLFFLHKTPLINHLSFLIALTRTLVTGFCENMGCSTSFSSWYIGTAFKISLLNMMDVTQPWKVPCLLSLPFCFDFSLLIKKWQPIKFSLESRDGWMTFVLPSDLHVLNKDISILVFCPGYIAHPPYLERNSHCVLVGVGTRPPHHHWLKPGHRRMA